MKARPCVISRTRRLMFATTAREYLVLEGVFAYPSWTPERHEATILAHPMACLWADALRSKEGRAVQDQPAVEFVS